MTQLSKRGTVIELAKAAGLGVHLPAGEGLPPTWVGVELAALERFYDGAARSIITMREMELNGKKIDTLAAAVTAAKEATEAENWACAQLMLAMREKSKNSLFRSALTCAEGAIRARQQPHQRCTECGYQHGHAIGCRYNPVDADLGAGGAA